MEPKIKITSCEYESGKSRLKIQANSIPDGCLVTFEGSDPSPAFIIIPMVAGMWHLEFHAKTLKSLI